MPLLIDPSPLRGWSSLDPVKEVTFVDRHPPCGLQCFEIKLEGFNRAGISIMEAAVSGIHRMISRDVEQGILINVAHGRGFALPVLPRVLDDAERIDPEVVGCSKPSDSNLKGKGEEV